MKRLALPLIAALVASTGLGAQGAAKPAAPPAAGGTQAPPAAAATPPAENLPVPPPNYVYSADGRRDPFVSLVNRGTDKQVKSVGKERPDGVAGVLVDEVVVRGLVENRGGWLAMIGAPTGKTYAIHAGDRLLDGTVHAITPEAVVLMQDVSDPLLLKKQREVRKYLRGEAK
jgi:Tfp pilus assembly protein PilP